MAQEIVFVKVNYLILGIILKLECWTWLTNALKLGKNTISQSK